MKTTLIKQHPKKDKILIALWLAIALLIFTTFYNIYIIFLLQKNLNNIEKSVQSLTSNAIYENLNLNDKNYQEQLEPLLDNFIVERTVPIVAVSTHGDGIIGNLTAKLIPGNNNVLINTNPFLDIDIQYSAAKAVTVAKLRAKKYNFDRDFIFDFKAGDAQLIGGESAGAAIAIATITALDDEELKTTAAITGTINPDGSIGKIAGVLEKAKAVADEGYKYFLIPKEQGKFTYYERQVTKEPTGFGFEIFNTRYVPKTIDIKEVAKEEWDLEVIEVADINEALPYFVE